MTHLGEYFGRGVMYVGEGLASLAVGINTAQAIAGVIEHTPELVQRGVINMLFYGAVIAFCSQYRETVDARHSLEEVVARLDSYSAFSI